MVIERHEYVGGLTAELRMNEDGVLVVEVRDPVMGDCSVTGFSCEAEARTFIDLGDFDSTPDNLAVRMAGMTGLRWS